MDDQQRGGDIDLFIQNNKEEYLTLQAKVNYLAELKRKIGDRKIDVVFDNDNTRQKKNFYRSVNKHKIEI